jgi:hypothetical protein
VKLKLEEAHGNKLFVLRVSDYQVQTSNDKKTIIDQKYARHFNHGA